MENFEIEIKEVLSRIVSIQAESKESAIRKVEEMYRKSEIVLDANDFVYKTIFHSKEKQEMKEIFEKLYDYMVSTEEKHYEESDKPKDHIFIILEKYKSLREKIEIY